MHGGIVHLEVKVSVQSQNCDQFHAVHDGNADDNVRHLHHEN